MRSPLACLAVVCATLPAAAQLVSPLDYANVRGNASWHLPFSGFPEINFQAIHGDLKGRSQPAVKGIAFRQGDSRGSAVARVLDVEIQIGEGDFKLSLEFDFASNFATTPVVALKRKQINFPDWTGQLPPLPPFDARFPFDAPWTFTGTGGFVWQMKMFSSSVAATRLTLVDIGSHGDLRSTSVITRGTACQSSDQLAFPNLGSTFWTFLRRRQHQVFWTGDFFPIRAPHAMLLGTTRISLPIPGLCVPLGVLPQSGIVAFHGTTDRLGTIRTGMVTMPFDADLVGTVIHSQAFAVDSGSSNAIPLVLSPVNSHAVPPPPSKSLATSYVYDAGPGSTASTSGRAGSTGAALVVQLMN